MQKNSTHWLNWRTDDTGHCTTFGEGALGFSPLRDAFGKIFSRLGKGSRECGAKKKKIANIDSLNKKKKIRKRKQKWMNDFQGRLSATPVFYRRLWKIRKRRIDLPKEFFGPRIFTEYFEPKTAPQCFELKKKRILHTFDIFQKYWSLSKNLRFFEILKIFRKFEIFRKF